MCLLVKKKKIFLAAHGFDIFGDVTDVYTLRSLNYMDETYLIFGKLRCSIFFYPVILFPLKHAMLASMN